MKLSNAFMILLDVRAALQFGFSPTLKTVWRRPSLLLKPHEISNIFMANAWAVFGKGSDDGNNAVKSDLIKPNAHGIVLDIGAGFGLTVNYLDREKITKYVALEPNTNMHQGLRQLANSAGYLESDGSLVILSCGAEDTSTIIEALGAPVDTIISVLTLCSVPRPEQTIKALVRDVLKPGTGQILFLEHVLNTREDIAWWQSFWTPMWKVFFDGCNLDRPTNVWIEEMMETLDNGEMISMWDEGSCWGNSGQDEETLFMHRMGRFVKKAI
ncbi:hypothetical protein C8J56DRAFT_922531 [Mycena floridula]|nr:hypothetical protein C8J56DRAFT_922531 [Mycena floridula]